MARDFINPRNWQFKNFRIPTHDRVEAFRKILETEQRRPFEYDEAEEVCMELLSLFDCLAGKRKLVPSDEPEVGQ